MRISNVPNSGRNRIKAGDCICADSNGVIVVPKNLVDDVAKLAMAIDENDKKILSAIKDGMKLTKAKKLFKCDTFANELMGVNQ